MIHIVLTILKILGIIILIILGLVLVLVLCVLFVPIRYSARVKYHEKLTVDARVSFLLRIISFRFIKDENTLTRLRIFGINTHLIGEKKKRKSNKKRFEEADKETEMFEQLSKELNQDKQIKIAKVDETYSSLVKIDEERDRLAEDKPVNHTENLDKTQTNNEKNEESKTAKEKNKESIFAKIKKKLLRIKYIFKKFCDTMKNVFKKIKWFKELLQDESTWLALRAVKKELKKLIKYIKPRKINGYLNFGFDNPSYTGQIYGFICMFYGKLPKDFLLYADFEKKVLEGDLTIKGSFRVYYLLIIAFKLYKNDNIKKVMERRRTYGRE